jgi:hypothetical protein
VRLRCDPAFFFTFDVAELARCVRSLRCCLLALHGQRSAWASETDGRQLAAMATSALVAASDAVPGAGHWLATDAPKELAARVAAFLEGPAVRSFDPAWLQQAASTAAAASGGDGGQGGGAADRRPEALGLRPLPHFATLEEAKKARNGHPPWPAALPRP